MNQILHPAPYRCRCLSDDLVRFWLDCRLDIPCQSITMNRLRNRLWNAGICCAGDLESRTREQVAAIKYVGPESIVFLEKYMDHRYIRFATQ
jgi:hypothetical protein